MRSILEALVRTRLTSMILCWLDSRVTSDQRQGRYDECKERQERMRE